MAKPPPAQRSDFLWFRGVPTRWMDNDVYGHVNNVHYYSYFDTAVNARLIAAGVLDLAGGETVCLVAETACVYRKALGFPDIVTVGLRVDRLGTSSVTYGLAAFRNDDADAAAECRYVHVHVRRADHRPVPFTPAWRAALEPLVAAA